MQNSETNRPTESRLKLGTSSYAPEGGRFTYMDVMDGKMKSGRFGDFTDNKAHEVAMLFDYTFDNGLKWNLDFKYMNAPEANYVDFGGINWKVNKHLSLGAMVVNFLNQKGASGTINCAELLSKDEASKFSNHYMSGNYLRPFTLEFSASLNF